MTKPRAVGFPEIQSRIFYHGSGPVQAPACRNFAASGAKLLTPAIRADISIGIMNAAARQIVPSLARRPGGPGSLRIFSVFVGRAAA
jgi:hypothetical protein